MENAPADATPARRIEPSLNMEAPQESDGEPRLLDVQQVIEHENLPLEGSEESNLMAESAGTSEGMISQQPENEGASGSQQEQETVVKLSPMRKDAVSQGLSEETSHSEEMVDTECEGRNGQGSDLLKGPPLQEKKKTYICSQCGKSFSSSLTVSRNRWLRIGQKLYRCRKCGKRFYDWDSLSRHQENSH